MLPHEVVEKVATHTDFDIPGMREIVRWSYFSYKPIDFTQSILEIEYFDQSIGQAGHGQTNLEVSRMMTSSSAFVIGRVRFVLKGSALGRLSYRDVDELLGRSTVELDVSDKRMFDEPGFSLWPVGFLLDPPICILPLRMFRVVQRWTPPLTFHSPYIRNPGMELALGIVLDGWKVRQAF